MQFSSLFSRIPSVFLATALLTALPSLQAGSVERRPVTADDLAQALGLDLHKFSAKFTQPVYATLTLRWRQPGEELASELSHSTTSPGLGHPILFTVKDYGKMQQLTGGTNAKQLKDIIEMDVKFSGTGFFFRDYNPLAKLAPGIPIQSWVKQQSFEDLPLNVEIPLVVEAAAPAKDKMMTVVENEYRTVSPAYIFLGVTFSKEAPPAPKSEETAPAPGKTAAPTPSAGPDKDAAAGPKK